MRTTLAAVTAALTVSAAAGYVVIDSATADSGTAGGAAAAKAGSSFTLVEHADTDTTTDTGVKGDSVGDVLTFHNPLYDAANKRRIGTDNGSCIRTLKGRAYECTWTNTLAGGSIVVAGPFYDAHDSTLAITGGTGQYASAQGTMVLHARNAAGSAYDFTFTLAQ